MEQEPTPPVEIPYTELSEEALLGVIESFVLREGTDYGPAEFTLQQKVSHVLAQLKRKDAKIMFDPDSETVTLAVNPR